MAYRKTDVKPNDLVPVPGGLGPGTQILIRGRVLPDQTRFSINFKCGKNSDDDIALHFNPRNDDGDTVVRNTLKGGSWQNEERDTPGFPFNNGSKFTIRIMTNPDCYHIMVNNNDFVRYAHRIPPSEVRYLQLTDGAEYYEVLVQNNCRVPFSGQFPGGLKIGQAVRVRGMVNDNAEKFVVNFQCDRDGNTIGFHFNPRIQENDVVLNSKLGGDWGSEQRGFENNYPFQRGEFFDIFFIALEGKFSVYVNEHFFTTFDYRCNHHDICHLSVSGDIELLEVELLNPLPNNFIKEIPQGLEKNDLIIVKGFFQPQGEKIVINLIKGTSHDDDIALHFNPRRSEGEVVFNSKSGGNWEDEERHPIPATMKEMVPFEVEILAKSDKFKVFTNDKKLCKYRARDDIEDIKAVTVGGDAYFYEVKLLRKLEEPFTDSLPGILEPGNWILIQGAPDDDSDRFSINLTCGKDIESSDIAFHFNPRFSEGETVRNTRKDGEWGNEERAQPYFPFKPEDRFELAIVTLSHGIRVFVNHRRYIDYNFRIGPEHICHIQLSGGCDYFEPEFY